MIIERIKVENFATYKQANLDFNDLGPTVSVFGSTGAGKTTFFVDAITLALYGRAYGQAEKKYAKQVIPSWASKSKVEIDFRVPGDSKYRVIRVLQRDGSSSAVLYKLSDDGRTLMPVATGVSAVEREIEKLVGLDFKTFMNTVVVRQGRVAELISRDLTPSERRKLFLKAFDIDFTKHRDKARELYLKTKSELDTVKKEIEKIGSEIDVERELKLKVVELEAQIKDFAAKLRKLTGEKEELSKKLTEIQSKLSEVERRIASLEQLHKTLSEHKGELEQVVKQLEKFKSLLERKDEVERKFEILSRQVGALEEMAELERNVEVVKESILRLKQLMSKRDSLLKELEASQQELEKVKEEVSKLQIEAKKYDELSEKITLIEIEISKLNGYSKFIKESINALKENFGDEVSCPVCNTKLSRDRANEAIIHLTKELSNIESAVKSLESDKRVIALEIEKLKDVKEKLRLKEIALSRLSAKIEQLESQIKDFEAFAKKLSEDEAKLDELTVKFSQLSSQYMLMFGAYVKIGEVKERLKTIKMEHEQISRELMSIKEAAGRIGELKSRRIKLVQLISQLEAELKEYPSLCELKEKLTTMQSSIQEKLGEVEQLISEVIGSKARVEEQLKQIVEFLKEIKAKKERLKELQARSEELEKKANAYLYLYQYVFHEKGLPLTLLKRYLKRVEEWADYYISRFLPGKSIKIEA
ncbi:MAG: hypothetical protein DRJ26_05365, partial [Candidatus Methanomethylicota archaeon]